MMKNKKLCMLLIFIFILYGCNTNDPKYINFNKKETLNYYTNEIFANILNGENYSLKMVDTNVSKSIPISDDEKVIIENFIDSLADSNFKKNTEDVTDKEPFQLVITFDNNSKYVFRIYSSNLVTVFPWDGNFPEDIITLENVPIHYNLYDFCTHIKNKSKLSG